MGINVRTKTSSRTHIIQMCQNHMTGKLEKSGYKITTKTSTNDITHVKRGRGRPKGSKNKKNLSDSVTVSVTVDSDSILSKKRGRPKGSKNKPKSEEEQVALTPAVKFKPRQPEEHISEPKEKDQETHPLFDLVKWLEKHMHPAQLQYYRGRANKNEVSLQHAILSDILGFFNVQDPKILKQVKKNNFIV